MRKILVSFLLLAVLSLIACQKAQEIEGPSVKVEARLRLQTDEGQAIDKEISLEGESGLETLGN